MPPNELTSVWRRRSEDKRQVDCTRYLTGAYDCCYHPSLYKSVDYNILYKTHMQRYRHPHLGLANDLSASTTFITHPSTKEIAASNGPGLPSIYLGNIQLQVRGARGCSNVTLPSSSTALLGLSTLLFTHFFRTTLMAAMCSPLTLYVLRPRSSVGKLKWLRARARDAILGNLIETVPNPEFSIIKARRQPTGER